MKLAWISELILEGKINPDEPNQRVDMVWQIGLDTYHYSWSKIIENPEILKEYDAALFIIPKKNPALISWIIDLVAKKYTKLILVQEGPCTLWQDWSAFDQTQYFNLLKVVDGIFVHGESDKKYYEGLANKKCFVLPTMINFEFLERIPRTEKVENAIMVGGNAGNWYSGTSSASIIQGIPEIHKVFFPSMGRRIENEDVLMSVITDKDIMYFPYTTWSGFITLLSQVKYAVHLMPAAAAGTFNLNCAVLGIPCIGNEQTDTQRICFPDLCCNVTDLTRAKELLQKLIADPVFFEEITMKALENSKYFSTEKQIPIVLQNIHEVINENH